MQGRIVLSGIQWAWIQFSFSKIGYHTKAKVTSLLYYVLITSVAQSAGAVEQTNCISADG